MAQAEEKEEQLPTMPPAAPAKPFRHFIAGDRMHLIKGREYYMVTLAPKVWYTADERKVIYEYFSQYDQVLGVTEIAAKKHLHVLHSSTVKKTGNVTRGLERLLTRNNIEWVKGVTIDVRHSVVPHGHVHYLIQEIKNGTRILTKGWQECWIQQILKEKLKSIPRKLLRKEVYVMNNIDGPDMVVKFADAYGMPLFDKRTVIACMGAMAKDKYRFHACKLRFILTDVLAMGGNDAGFISMLEMEFQMIDC